MTKKIHISDKAKLDLKEIYNYTLQEWGKIQANKYLSNLQKRFKWLLENPNLGKHRPEIKHNYYSFNESRHIIFYKIDKNNINILNILHKKMDINNFFDN